MKPSLTIMAYINVVKTEWIYPCSRFLVGITSTYARIAQAQILTLALAAVTFGTSIVVVRTPSEVVLGADSRATFDDGKIVTYKAVCKIYQSKGIFYAIAGLTVNPITGFDPAIAISNEIDRTSAISMLVPAVERAMAIRLTRELEWQKRERPAMYQRYVVENDNMALSVVIAGTENGLPVFYARAFKADGTILREDHPAGTFTVWIGKAKAIERFVARNRNYDSPTEAVRTLIQLEVDDSEPSVGPPIDIVRITKDGACWIQHKKECDENIPACQSSQPSPPPFSPPNSQTGTIAVWAVLIAVALGAYAAKRRFFT